MTDNSGPFWDKTLRRIRDILPLGETAELKDRVRPGLPDSDRNLVRQAIDHCLAGKGGEVSARSRAAELGRVYLVLNRQGRRRFLELLALDYGIDSVAVEKAIEARSGITSPLELQQANHQLQDLLNAPRTKLLAHFNELQNGVKFLVDMRAELMEMARENPELKALDRDIYRLLVSWFDIGFLDLRRITWETPAAILEKLIQYEAVHAISSWKDMKNRLRPDRRCYGFFHPRMPDEPLIFVEVALVNGLADNVLELLDVEAAPGDPDRADTAIFYSISNCQRGLAGVSFGNFLIKRVVADLATEYPNLKIFSTLSPIPGFMRWLEDAKPDCTPKEKTILEKIVAVLEESTEDTLAQGGMWHTISDETRNFLMKLCAGYLLLEKRGNQALDRVAHFHLCNGAQVERINWGANMTQGGIRQSASMMVNYLYKLPQIEKNHEHYRGKGVIAASPAVRKLLKGTK